MINLAYFPGNKKQSFIINSPERLIVHSAKNWIRNLRPRLCNLRDCVGRKMEVSSGLQPFKTLMNYLKRYRTRHYISYTEVSTLQLISLTSLQKRETTVSLILNVKHWSTKVYLHEFFASYLQYSNTETAIQVTLFRQIVDHYNV